MDRNEIPSPPEDKQIRTWAMAIHLSQFANFVFPFAGFVAPIVIWQVQKDKMPQLDEHGKIVANWLISSVIYVVLALILTFVLVGIPLLFLLGAFAVVYPIIGAIKASNGEAWSYPGSIKFFRLGSSDQDNPYSKYE